MFLCLSSKIYSENKDQIFNLQFDFNPIQERLEDKKFVYIRQASIVILFSSLIRYNLKVPISSPPFEDVRQT